MRFFIKEIKCDVAAGGMACGPISGPVVAEATIVTDSGGEYYAGLMEEQLAGVKFFYKTDNSFFDMLISGDYGEKEGQMVEDHCDLITESYWDVYSDQENEDYELRRYLTYIVTTDWDECKEMMSISKGKWLDEIEIPRCKTEEEYYEELEEEES